MNFRGFIYLLAALMLMAGCSRNYIEPNLELHHAYFPVEDGHTLIYQVDSVLFNPLFSHGRDSSSWLLKEKIVSSFTDNTGRNVHRIERFIRKDTISPWRPVQVFFVIPEKERIEKVEHNVRFLPLVFPPAEGKTWLGNVHINTTDTLRFYRNWVYKFENVHQPMTFNGMQLDSTLIVLEVDDETFLDRRYSIAKYAKNIGLIYKEQYNLSIVDQHLPDPELPWTEKANRGFIYTMTLLSYE